MEVNHRLTALPDAVKNSPSISLASGLATDIGWMLLDAGPHDRGVPQDPGEAARWYRSAAAQGYPYAQNNLGVLYQTGRGVAPNDAEPRKWFRTAAEQRLAVAQYNLGLMCESGQGAPQDCAEAGRWFRAAAEQDNADAQANLAVLYENGRGTEQDYAEALKGYRRAAEQGQAAAQLNLGIMHFYSRGVPRDYVEAPKWLNLAAGRFPPSATEKRARAIRNRDIVAKKLTAQRLVRRRVSLRAWKPRQPAAGREDESGGITSASSLSSAAPIARGLPATL
jgi:hypothetical protein